MLAEGAILISWHLYNAPCSWIALYFEALSNYRKLSLHVLNKLGVFHVPTVTVAII